MRNMWCLPGAEQGGESECRGMATILPPPAAPILHPMAWGWVLGSMGMVGAAHPHGEVQGGPQWWWFMGREECLGTAHVVGMAAEMGQELL